VARKKRASPPRSQAPAAWLFVDDDDRVVRFPVAAEQVRIGRDQTNDIWIEHPDVHAKAVIIARRDTADVLKVHKGARVRLNGEFVSNARRLRSGDRIGLADREFLYARDDMMPDLALSLTISRGEQVLRAVVIRKPRIRLGRRDADIVLDDASVSDRHLVIEAFAPDALFVSDAGSSMGTRLDGMKLDGRARLADGARIRVGRLTLAVRVLAADGLGLLSASPARPAPTRPAVEVPGPTAQVSTDADHEVPPPTVIGSLADLARADQGEEMPRRTRKRKRPAGPAKPARPRRQPSAPAAAAPPAPRTITPPPPVPVAAARPRKAEPTKTPRRSRKRRADVEQVPSVQIKPEVYERGGDVDAPPGPRSKEPARRYGAGRARDRDSAGMRPVSRGHSGSMHEQLTDVINANNVQDMVGERYVAAYQNAAQRGSGEPRADNRRYRPSKEAEVEPPTGRDPNAKRDPFGLHRQATFQGGKDAGKLTGVLDIVGEKPRLSRDRHALDPDAMPEQLRAQQELERQRGRRDRIDEVNRKRPYQVIDDSPRYHPDDDE